MGPKGVPDTKTDRPTDRRSKHRLTNYWGITSVGFHVNRSTGEKNGSTIFVSQESLCFVYEVSIVQYSHTVLGTHETS
jgi:hypothetical protein